MKYCLWLASNGGGGSALEWFEVPIVDLARWVFELNKILNEREISKKLRGTKETKRKQSPAIKKAEGILAILKGAITELRKSRQKKRLRQTCSEQNPRQARSVILRE